jgi:hypothetical protein
MGHHLGAGTDRDRDRAVAAMFAASFLVMMIALNFTAAPGELSSETDSDDGQELRSVKNASAPSF